MAIASIASAVVGISGSTIEQRKARKDAEEAARQQQAARREAAEARRRQARMEQRIRERQTRRARVESARQARARRAQIQATSTQAGVAETSSAQGAIGSIRSQFGQGIRSSRFISGTQRAITESNLAAGARAQSFLDQATESSIASGRHRERAALYQTVSDFAFKGGFDFFKND